MAKTTHTGVNIADFINSYVENEQKKTDSFRLIELMQKWTDSEPKMWGVFHYRIWKLSL